MINKNILINLEKNIEEIERYVNKLKNIVKEINRKKEMRKNFYKLYLDRYFDEKEYRRRIKIIEKKIKYLERSKYLILYDLINLINNSQKIVEFLKNIEEKSEEENKNIQYYQMKINNTMNYINQVYPEIFKKEEIKIGKRFIEASNVLFRKRKEKKKKIKIKLKLAEEYRINYYEEIKNILIRFSYKIFGGLSRRILNNSPKIYFYLKYLLKETYHNIEPDELLSIMLLFLSIIILVAIFISLYFLNIFYLIYGVLIFLSTIGLVVLYFNYKKQNIIEDINRNLPFAIIHMASLADSGIEIKYIIKIISEIEEYGYLSKEFKKIYDKISLGEGLVESLRSVADDTLSKDLKDFLEELILTITSGRKISEFLILYSQQEMIRYNSFLKKINQVMKTFSDLYVGMVLTIPMIIISIGVMLLSILQQTYNINIQGILEIITYIGLPIINIGFIILFDKLTKE
jgi:pilus assembly protein TadC